MCVFLCDGDYYVSMFTLVAFLCGVVVFCMDILMDVNQKHEGVKEDKKKNARDFFKDILG